MPDDETTTETVEKPPEIPQNGPDRPEWVAGGIRWLAALGGTAAAVLVLRWAIKFMSDVGAPARLMGGIYDLFGQDATAAIVRERGLSQLTNKIIISIVALIIGIVGVWALFISVNAIVDRFKFKWRERIRPWVFVGPAILLLGLFLVYPVVNTIYTSLSEDIVPNVTEEVPAELTGQEDILAGVVEQTDRVEFRNYLINGTGFEIARVTVTSTKDDDRSALLVLSGGKVRPLGLSNYTFALTDPDMRIAFRNNLLWLVIGTGGAVILGLLIATLVDRVKREALAKTFIFLPLAISMVGAAVIWRFVYYWRPPGASQIGLLNAIKTGLGGEPTAWVQTPPINTLALIVIMVWLQTGFAMVILSAALKGVPNEIVEAARIDGANEFQLFFRVIVPTIRGSIITVSTTVFIAILKVFDIVFVMTGGRFDTEVIANRMFTEMFTFRNFGRASSLAVVLLIVTIPIMVINIRNLRRQGIGV